METKEELTRLTVNLTPKGKSALDAGVKLTGDNMTDVVNRALQLYNYFLENKESLFVVDSEGSSHRVIIL